MKIRTWVVRWSLVLLAVSFAGTDPSAQEPKIADSPAVEPNPPGKRVHTIVVDADPSGLQFLPAASGGKISWWTRQIDKGTEKWSVFLRDLDGKRQSKIDLDTGKAPVGFEPGQPNAILLSPDAKEVALNLTLGAAGAKAKSELARMELGSAKSTFSDQNTGSGFNAAWADDGTLAVVRDRTCFLIEKGKNAPAREFKVEVKSAGPMPRGGANLPPQAIAFSPDGGRIAFTVFGGIRIYDSAKGVALDTPPTAWKAGKDRQWMEESSLVFAARADDERLLAVEKIGGMQGSTCQARLIDLKSMKVASTVVLEKPDAESARQVSARGFVTSKGELRVFVTRTDFKDPKSPKSTCQLVDPGTGKILRQFDSTGWTCQLDRNGNTLVRFSSAKGKKTVEIWNLVEEK